MRQVTTVLAACLVIAISSVAFAQQAVTGTVTTIDRINGTIVIKRTQDGTVGASAGGATEQFKTRGDLLDTLHAGDRGTFSVSETAGAKTITTFEKQ